MLPNAQMLLRPLHLPRRETQRVRSTADKDGSARLFPVGLRRPSLGIVPLCSPQADTSKGTKSPENALRPERSALAPDQTAKAMPLFLPVVKRTSPLRAPSERRNTTFQWP